ncbi:MAG TPA: alkaline phosphatase family protein, partial [Chitinophagaceae bacterium]|nr:alkaline phosphatase family protein [Chitinophagaceae bacterium]
MKLFSTLLLSILTTLSFAQKTTSTATPNTSKPKLVIGIMIDHMRWDYLYKYQNRYTNDGFKKLLKEGFTCENTFIPYTPTATACGHASAYTGTVPAIHGIASNNWW